METRCISSNRSLIIRVLEREIPEAPRISFSPHFTYSIGNYTLYRNGLLEVPDDTYDVFKTLSALSLCDYPYRPEEPEEDEIFCSLKPHTPQTLLNLFCIISARQNLLNRALDSKNAFFISPELMKKMLAHPPESIESLKQILYFNDNFYHGIRLLNDYIVFSGFQKGHPEGRPKSIDI